MAARYGGLAERERQHARLCPAYPLYSDNVTWPSTSVMVPSALLDQYGDLSVVEEHYASARKWMEYMGGFVTNGIIARDAYGDWCVPPEDPKLIHSKDPKRKTNGPCWPPTYFYKDAQLMAEYARQSWAGRTTRRQFQRKPAETPKDRVQQRVFHPRRPVRQRLANLLRSAAVLRVGAQGRSGSGSSVICWTRLKARARDTSARA